MLNVNAGQHDRGRRAPFNFPDDVDLWLRLSWDLKDSRGAHFAEAVARLRPGVGVEQASRRAGAVSGRLAREFPQTNGGWLASPVRLLDDMLSLPARADRAPGSRRARARDCVPQCRRPPAGTRDAARAKEMACARHSAHPWPP
jgi:hypothetical protein